MNKRVMMCITFAFAWMAQILALFCLGEVWANPATAAIAAAVPADSRPARLDNGLVRVDFDLAGGTYTLGDAVSGKAVVEGAHGEVARWATTDARYAREAKIAEIADELGQGRSLLIECTAAGKPSLLLEFRIYQDKSFVVLRGGWKNTSEEKLRVNDFRPLTGGTVFQGGNWSDIRTLTANTSANDPEVRHSPYASCANNLLLTLKRDNQRCSLVLGALKTADFTKWTHTLPEGGVSLRQAALLQALPECHLAAYLDCGNPMPVPYQSKPVISLKQGEPYQFPNPFPGKDGGQPFSSIVFHNKAVRFEIGQLDPARKYILGFSWWDANGDGRRGSVTVAGNNGKSYVLVDKEALPSGSGQGLPREYACAIPRDACESGALRLDFSNEAPVPNIVVGEVWLWETDGDKAIPAEWSQGHAVSAGTPDYLPDSATMAILEATDPVGKLLEPGDSYLPEDSFYVDFLTPDPFVALEQYGAQLRLATHARPNPYDFPTVCAWYAGVWHTPGAGNHPEKSTYKINTTPGIVEESAEIKKSGFLNYSRAAIRLVPDNYTPNNPQGWWDDEHWQQHGLYVAPFQTSQLYGKGVHENGCLAFTYFQPTCTWSGSLISLDFRQAHPGWLCGKDINRTLDYTLPEVQNHLRKVFAAMRGGIDGMMFDYCDDLWFSEASKGGFADPHTTGTAFYRTLFRFAREGLGPDSWIHERNVNQPNNDLTLGLTDSQRTEWDTDKITPQLVSRSALRWYKNRVVINYDMDSKDLNSSWKIEGWTGSDQDGRRMMLTMASVAASRLLLANSFRDLSRETLYDLARTFPYWSEPKSARPVDAFVSEGCPRVYDFAVTGDWHQLTLFNNTLPTRAETFTVPLAGEPVDGALGLDPEKDYYCYDFWNDRLAGRVKGSASLVQELRPGEARMIAVHKVQPNPQLLATDRHIMQGYLDLAKYPVWDGSRQTLCGASRVVGGEPYRIILATNGFGPMAATAPDANARIETLDAADGLVALRLESPGNAVVEWTVIFQKDKK